MVCTTNHLNKSGMNIYSQCLLIYCDPKTYLTRNSTFHELHLKLYVIIQCISITTIYLLYGYFKKKWRETNWLSNAPDFLYGLKLIFLLKIDWKFSPLETLFYKNFFVLLKLKSRRIIFYFQNYKHDENKLSLRFLLCKKNM